MSAPSGVTSEQSARLISAARFAIEQALPEGAAPDRGPLKLGVALSGGSDSSALLHLSRAALPDASIMVATVDHGLRAEARDEAEAVGRICRHFGFSHEILTWVHQGRLSGNLQAEARQARYALLAAWARREGLDAVLIGHSRDDLAETFLMGMARSAGLDGLTAMAPRFEREGMVFLRPLLALTREELRGYLQNLGQGWIDDPSNERLDFARIRTRKALAGLGDAGITSAQIAAVEARLRPLREMLDRMVAKAAQAGAFYRGGALFFERAAWQELEPEVARRLLQQALRELTRAAYAPRALKLTGLMAALNAGQQASLSGCLLSAQGAHMVLAREPRALEVLTLTAGAERLLWDRRWQIAGPLEQGMVLSALGARGVAELKDWRDLGLPRRVLEVMPALWSGDRLISAPALEADFAKKNALSLEFCAQILPLSDLFRLSH